MKKWLYILVVFLMLISVVQVVAAYSTCIPTLSVKPQQVIRGDAVVFSGDAYSFSNKGGMGAIAAINLWETPRGLSKKQNLKWIDSTLITDWTLKPKFRIGKYSIKIYPKQTSNYQVSCTLDYHTEYSNKVKVTVIDQIIEP